jgi:hypothetical protein
MGRTHVRLWITSDQVDAAAAAVEVDDEELEPESLDDEELDLSDDELDELADSEPPDPFDELLTASRLSVR